MFFAGDDPHDSAKKFLCWIKNVANETLPCGSTSTYGNPNKELLGVFHHLKAGDCDEFMRMLADKMEEWEFQCHRSNQSCGTILMISSSGKGECHICTRSAGCLRDRSSPYH